MSNDNRATARETNLPAESGCGCGSTGAGTGGCGGEAVAPPAPAKKAAPVEPKEVETGRPNDSCCGGGSCG